MEFRRKKSFLAHFCDCTGYVAETIDVTHSGNQRAFAKNKSKQNKKED
jgi:hypothetical protein